MIELTMYDHHEGTTIHACAGSSCWIFAEDYTRGQKVTVHMNESQVRETVAEFSAWLEKRPKATLPPGSVFQAKGELETVPVPFKT